jgi:arsenate reductase (thioredoxin)
MSAKQRVLFVCTHNSARSQMAEAFLRELAGDRFDVASAGTQARGVHPLAIQAMAEQGIDISLQKSKIVEQFLDQRFDLVITVCDDAAEACPVFPNAAERRHWSFPDPSAVLGDAEQRFAAFASVRDAIRQRIEREIVHKDVATGTR